MTMTTEPPEGRAQALWYIKQIHGKIKLIFNITPLRINTS